MKTDKVTIIASSGIELREYRNLALIPAFYFLPKYDLDLFDPWVFQIPRNPHRIINNPKALELIESDRFVAMLQYIYRHMAWQFLNVGMNIYTASEEIYGALKKDIGEILRKLCDQKKVEIIEAERYLLFYIIFPFVFT